jgi:ariadne-1
MALSDCEDYGDSECEESEEGLDAASDSEDEDEYGFQELEQEIRKEEDAQESLEKVKYSVMGPRQITEKQEEFVEYIKSVLSVDPDTATSLLRNFMWSVSRLTEEWFQDEDKVRAKVGLLSRDAQEYVDKTKEFTSDANGREQVRKIGSYSPTLHAHDQENVFLCGIYVPKLHASGLLM